jgi:uncharacterized protein with PIN domain
MVQTNKKDKDENFVYHNLNFLNNSNFEGRNYRYICDSSLARVGKHLRMLGIDTIFSNDINANYLLFLARRDDRIILTKNRNMVKQIINMKYNHDLKLQQKQKIVEESEEVQRWRKEREEWQKKEREQYEIDNDIVDETDDIEEEDNYYEYKYYFVKSRQNLKMIEEVVNTFRIRFLPDKVFSICLKCNHEIVPIGRENKEQVKDRVFPSVYAKYDEFFRCTSCGQIYWGADSSNLSYATALRFAKDYSYDPERAKRENTDDIIDRLSLENNNS